MLMMVSALSSLAQAPMDGGVWKDNTGKHINAHGGNIFNYKGTYYWYGESRSEDGKPYSSLGVSCFTSKDLKSWTNHGLVLPVSKEAGSDIEGGCIIERPKVLFNKKTQTFVMWFHLELKGKGYAAARYAVATSKTPFGPFKFIRSGRVNPGLYPIGFAKPDTTDLKHQLLFPEMKKWWTPEWRQQIERGMFWMRDFEGGQMARDMTIFIDDDGKAYHICSSESNSVIHIAELTDDYLDFSGKYVRAFIGDRMEAPAIFKKDGLYYFMGSECTGWRPNPGHSAVAPSIWGPWTQLGNPCVDADSETTYHSQSTFFIPVAGKKDAYIYMGDRWTPDNAIDGRYVWLPVEFEDGRFILHWRDEWDLSVFDKK